MVKAVPRKGRMVQSLKDYVYIKGSYFDMKVPVHILPADSNASDHSLKVSSPRLVVPRPPKSSLQDLSVKSPDEKLDEQFARAKDLSQNLERAKAELGRRQQSLEEVRTRKSVELAAEMSVVEQVKSLLREKQPDLEKLVSISLMQERAKHERQSEKVVQILRAKDSQINELQQKALAAESALQAATRSKEQIQAEFNKLQEQYDSALRSERKLKQSVDEHEETIKLLSENHEQLRVTLRGGATPQEYEREISMLRQQLEALAIQSQKEKNANESLSKELNEAQYKLQELSKREAFVLEFASRQEEFKKEHLNELSKKADEVKTATDAQEELKAMSKQLEAQLESEIAKSTELEVNLNSAKAANEQLKAELTRLQDECKSNHAQLESIAQVLSLPANLSKALAIESPQVSSKNYASRIKESIRELQDKANILESTQETLESRLKLAESTAASQQVSNADIVKKYTEEISHLQHSLMQLEKHKITKHAEAQTALKGSNIADLNHMIGDYRGKLEFAEQQRDERERHIARLENDLRKEAEESEKARGDLEAVVRKYEESRSSLSRLDENEVVAKLNSRVSALQVQVHQLQSKLKEAEDQLSKRSQRNESQADEGSKSKVAEHVAERMEALELTIVQLREEVIQLEVDKRNIQQVVKQELDVKDARIKALQNALNASSNPSIATRVEFEELKEVNKTMEARVKASKEEFIAAQKELFRLKQSDRLANILPIDGEIALKLTNKLKAQKAEVRKLRSLLKRAKAEFDKMSMALQSRGEKVATKVIARESQEFDWENFVSARYEQKTQELISQCQEYKKKLNDSLKLFLQLKEEFAHKLMDSEEHSQRKLLKFAEEVRLKSKETQNLSQRVERLATKVQEGELHITELEESKAKTIADLSEKIKQLEDRLSKERYEASQIQSQVKKQELIIQERSAQIAVLMETIEVLQKSVRDELAQRYMNTNSELCSIRSVNAKLEIKVSDLNFDMKKQKETVSRYEDLEGKWQQEKFILKEEMAKLKKTVEFQGKEIERFEKEYEDSRVELINESAKANTLAEQLLAKEKRIEVLKTQLSNSHSKKLSNTSIVVKPIDIPESRQLAVLVKELLAEAEANASPLPKLCDIILKADRTIQSLQRTNAELEQQLSIAKLKESEEAFDLLCTKCSVLEHENTELQLLFESLVSSKEKVWIEESFRLSSEANELRSALHKTNKQMIELAAENAEVKAALAEAQDRFEMKTREMQLARVKLEKELAMAKVKAEEEASLKLTVKNEEIKTYFDTNVARLILDKDEDLSLAKEIYAQKLSIEKMQSHIDKLNSEKSLLEVQANDLTVMVSKQMEELIELHNFSNSKYIKKQKLFNELSINTKELSYKMGKKALKVVLDKKTIELMEANSGLARLKKDNTRLQLQLAAQKVNSEFESVNGKIVDELNSKITNLVNEIARKNKIIEDVERKIKDSKAECALEMKSLKSDLQLQLQSERRKIMEEYSNLERKYKPGEAPGEILAENQNLHRSCIALKQVAENLESEVVVLRQKLESVSEDAAHFKDEAELHKKALLDVEDLHEVRSNFHLLSTPSVSGRSKILSSERRGKESKKKLQTSAMTDKSLKAEDEIPKVPKLIKAILQAKYNEAAAVTQVRRLAREDMETRKQLANAQSQLKDLESKLRHYERLLKDNNVEFIKEEEEQQRVLWMKRRILELEATCEDLRVKEMNKLSEYQIMGTSEQSAECLDESVSSLLLNGVIALCNKLTLYEVQGKDCKSSNRIERLQRLIIKTLTAFVRKLQGDTTWNLQCAIPSNEKDRQVWYLELAELQAQRAEEAVTRLKEYTSRVAVEVTGSFSSAAQVKAAAMELANQTKEAADEAANLKTVCSLVRVDMEISAEVKSLLTNKENCKRVKNKAYEKQSKSISILAPSESDKELEVMKGEVERLVREKTLNEVEMQSLKSRNLLLDKEIGMAREQSAKLREEAAGCAKKLAEASLLLEETKKSCEASLKESAGKVAEMERLVEEEKERMRQLSIENKELKAKYLVLSRKAEQLEAETMKKLQEENKELDAKLQKEMHTRKSEIERWMQERGQMQELIASLKLEKRKKIKQTKEPSGILSDSEATKPTKNRKKGKLKEELVTKSEEICKLNAQVKELSSRLALSELNVESERRKVVSLTEDLKSPSVIGCSSDSVYIKEVEEIKLGMNEIKISKEKLEQEIAEGTRREEEYRREREKMIAVIQELDHELKLRTNETAAQQSRLEELSSIIILKDNDLQLLNAKCRELDNNFLKAIEELNAARDSIEKLKGDIQLKEQASAELQASIESKEEELSKLKKTFMTLEEEHNKAMLELKEEYKSAKTSAEQLVSTYEHQLKTLKDKFREECAELNNRLTSQLQAKGMISGKKKDEDFIGAIAQLAQKDAQIKNLEKECAKVESKLANTKSKLKKLQAQTDPKNKIKIADSQKVKPSVKTSINSPISDKCESMEDRVRAYNKLLKKKTELEFKLEKAQNSLKGTECKLTAEKDKTREMTEKSEELKKELENNRELLKASKKEQNELIKKHKNELQKVLDDLFQMKNNWRSPEELNRCVEEKQELESQVKALKEELSRKKDLIKQWKEKEETRQSETGQLMSEVESIKDDSEKLRRALKELGRKDQTIRSLKAAAETSRVQEKQLGDENKALAEKLKQVKSEAARKDVALKTLRERSEEVRGERDAAREKEAEIEKLKARAVNSKQEIERKDDQVKTLKNKIEFLMQEQAKLKSELEAKSKEDGKGTERFAKCKQVEGKNQQLSVLLRMIFRELLTSVEKLRIQASAHRQSKAESKVETDFYKESLDILGIGAEDIGEFVSEGSESNNEDLVELIEKINRLVENKEVDKDYDDVIEGYKALAKEKAELEKLLNPV